MLPRYSQKTTAWVVGGVALVLRLLFIAVAGRSQGIRPGTDSVSYDAFARLMMSGWKWLTTPLAVREPLYPAFMAFAYALPTPDLGTLQILQALVGAAAAVALYLGLRSLAGEAVAGVAGLLVAVNPHFVADAGVPSREVLIAPLIVGFIVSFLHAVSRGGARRCFVCVLCFVLLAHTDVRFVPLVALVPVMAFAYHRRARLAWRQSLWMLLFFLLLMVPYQIRGYMAMGRPVIITERFLGTWLPRAGAVMSERSAVGSLGGRQAWLAEFESRKRASLQELTPQEREYFLAGGRPAVGRLAVHWTLLGEYWRFAQFSPMYRPYPDGRFAPPWSTRHNVTSSIVVIPFLLLFPVALLMARGAVRQLMWPLVVFLGAHSLLHVFVHARERYRIPMEVVMAVLVAMALVSLWPLLPRSNQAR